MKLARRVALSRAPHHRRAAIQAKTSVAMAMLWLRGRANDNEITRLQDEAYCSHQIVTGESMRELLADKRLNLLGPCSEDQRSSVGLQA